MQVCCKADKSHITAMVQSGSNSRTLEITFPNLSADRALLFVPAAVSPWGAWCGGSVSRKILARFYSQNCMINNSFSALVCTLAKDCNAFRWWWERRRLPRRFGWFSLRHVNHRVSRVKASSFPWHAPCRAKPSLKQRSRHLQSQKGRKPRCDDFPRVQRSMNSLSNSTVQFSELSHQAACLSCPFRNRWKRLPKKMRKLKRRQIQRHTWRLPRIHSAWGRTCLGQEHVKTWTCHRLAVSCSEVM